MTTLSNGAPTVSGGKGVVVVDKSIISTEIPLLHSVYMSIVRDPKHLAFN